EERTIFQNLFSSREEVFVLGGTRSTASLTKKRKWDEVELVPPEIYERTSGIHESAQVPRVRPRISARSDTRLRVRLRPARSRLRLRSHQKIFEPRRCSVAPQKHVALSRIVARRWRPDCRDAGWFHAARESRPAGESARYSRSVDQERHRQLSIAFV